MTNFVPTFVAVRLGAMLGGMGGQVNEPLAYYQIQTQSCPGIGAHYLK